MKKVFKWLSITVLIFVIVISGLVGYVTCFLPNVGAAPEIKVAITPERVQRGAYLANSVAVCMDCHSKRDWTKYSGPIPTEGMGCGGEIFDQKLGFPGIFYSKNITPYNLKNWTDGEIYRTITTGVNKYGKALMPVMPYHYYGQADTEDVYAIIAYIRTLPEVKNDVPKSKADFPFSIILNTIPQKAAPMAKPSPSDSVAYGAYLVRMAACVECHTKVDDKAQLIDGTQFGGGREFKLPWGTIRTANITPDATGIGNWTRDLFVSRFKMYADSAYTSPTLTMNDFNTIMPWTMYGKMTESDISSIFQYLRTLKPINNTVEKFSPKGNVAATE